MKTAFGSCGIKKARYDLIINDSTDPLGHTEGLFTKEFYGSCYKALRDDGIMVYQHGSPFMMRMRWNAERCTERFSGHFR